MTADSSRTLVILGAGGDLTARLLLPGVGQFLAGARGTDIQLIGVGFDPMSEEDWRTRVTTSFALGKAEGARIDAVIAGTTYLQADVTKAEDLSRIFAACTAVPALYFALPPAVTVAACTAMAEIEIPAGTVLGLEKPFGTNLETAKALNRLITRLVPEEQVFRIDHFLGKSTVINLLGLRFANRIFEPVWSSQHIERVDIVFDETLALEDRAGYYDKAGALVDMIQSHLLLVMALVAIEAPTSVYAEDIRGAMTQTLRATRIWDDDAVSHSRRARYTAGTIEGRSLASYVDESGVHPERGTETLAEMTVSIDNWRWAGVPFTLRSGKALAGRRKEILITFKDVPHLPTGLTGHEGPEVMRISLSPDELELDINVNGGGDPFVIDRVTLSTTFAAGEMGPYGEVIAGILSNDLTLSLRADEVEQCWRIVEPVLAAWRAGDVPLEDYAAGSLGPDAWRLSDSDDDAVPRTPAV
jgi:glucose-6-phosphate 1-dehydrogenase